MPKKSSDPFFWCKNHAWGAIADMKIRFCGHCGKVRAWKPHPEACDCRCHSDKSVKVTACNLCGFRAKKDVAV